MLLLQKPPEEALRGVGVAPGLNEDVEHDAILIDGAPEIVLHALDPDEDLASCPGESSPPGAPRTVREALTSYGSRCSTVDKCHAACLIPKLLPSPVGLGHRLSNAAPSVQSHYRTFNPTTSHSAPVPRIGTLVLSVFADWTSPFASGRQVLTFRTRAWSGFAPPICRMPLGQASGPPPNWSRRSDAPPVSASSLAFRHVISGSLSLASPDHT